MGRKRHQRSEFAQRLVQLRRARRLTQVELAKQLGVTQGVVSHYENNLTEPTAPLLAKLARTLRVSADQLLGLDRLPDKLVMAESREELRLMRRLRQVVDLPPNARRTILDFIDAFTYRQKQGAQHEQRTA